MSTPSNIQRRRRIARITISALAAAAVLAALVVGPDRATAAPNQPPDVPSTVVVPAGNVLSSVGHAQGFQIYTCQVLAIGYGWLLQQPQAVLTQNGQKPFALHYGGPSWTAMNDGSTVVATKVDSAPAPGGGTIPWLLLKQASASGPVGGTFTDTTFIQRINTTGGLAPVAGCDADHVGATVPVFYTADYYFYRAA